MIGSIPMCGRAYSTYSDEELEMRYRHLRPRKLPEFQSDPNYNMAPTQSCLILRSRLGESEFARARWGLVPAWAKTIQDASKYSLINAKGEEIEVKRSYQAAFRQRRCIVPLSGFVEWSLKNGKKRPFKIFLKDSPVMSAAGVWESWKSPEGALVESFSIITTSANPFMKPIHDRMPVILNEEAEIEWLNPKLQDPRKLKTFLKPCPAEWLAAEEISTLINSPKNNRPEVLLPVEADH